MNKPISPLCIALFGAVGSKLHYVPYIREIDIKQCQVSSLGDARKWHYQNKRYFFYKNLKNSEQGTYYYQFVGVSDNHIYIVHTWNSDGKGHSTDALQLMTMIQQKIFAYTSESDLSRQIKGTSLRLIGYIGGGNQCQGGIKSVRIEKNTLWLQQYPKRNSVKQCDGLKEYKIDLSQLNTSS